MARLPTRRAGPCSAPIPTSLRPPKRGGATGATQRLNFGSLATVGLRLFADLGQQPGLVRNNRWLRGTRISLGVDNLFNARQRVTDANGTVPINYQPGYLDPNGRVVRLTLRKLFF